MTKTQLLARLVLTYLLMCVVFEFFRNVYVPLQMLASYDMFSFVQPMAMLISLIVIASAMSWALLFYLPPRAEALFAIDTDGDKVDTRWVVAGHRIVLMCWALSQLRYNIRFLIQTGYFLITAPRVLVDMIVYRYVDPMFRIGGYTVANDLLFIAEFIFWLYMLLGAPRLVSWLCGRYERDLAAIQTSATNASADGKTCS